MSSCRAQPGAIPQCPCHFPLFSSCPKTQGFSYPLSKGTGEQGTDLVLMGVGPGELAPLWGCAPGFHCPDVPSVPGELSPGTLLWWVAPERDFPAPHCASPSLLGQSQPAPNPWCDFCWRKIKLPSQTEAPRSGADVEQVRAQMGAELCSWMSLSYSLTGFSCSLRAKDCSRITHPGLSVAGTTGLGASPEEESGVYEQESDC